MLGLLLSHSSLRLTSLSLPLYGLNGVPDVEECSYVQSTITELPFFASKVRLGKNGVEDVLDLGPLSDFEKEGLEALKPKLKSFIEKGVKFANQ
ncbi:hypothetical protein Bca52824_081533 [Brassica carinata]|uniref:Lactate/malate dehydrogenase C-terminal domain-containing protein n=1 Tax=Brassica carinata TaxID=52824 RepID=A0A8X7PIP3_BRACI|nr:hypothetical protein Bca52824_081533 [Brassica carinata]